LRRRASKIASASKGLPGKARERHHMECDRKQINDLVKVHPRRQAAEVR
jgi:hypothetical protein